MKRYTQLLVDCLHLHKGQRHHADIVMMPKDIFLCIPARKLNWFGRNLADAWGWERKCDPVKFWAISLQWSQLGGLKTLFFARYTTHRFSHLHFVDFHKLESVFRRIISKTNLLFYVKGSLPQNSKLGSILSILLVRTLNHIGYVFGRLDSFYPMDTNILRHTEYIM